MNVPQYYFGYLFVRFARIFALVAFLATAGAISYIGFSYKLESDRVRYHRSSTLALELRQFEEETNFARDEVGRIADVADLAANHFDAAPDSIDGFTSLLAQLQQADQARQELKRRVTAKFDIKMAELRQRIHDVIQNIERTRVPNSPIGDVGRTQSSAIREPASSEAPSARTVFDSVSRSGFREMRITIEHVEKFLDDLSRKAEREESQRLIRETKEALANLSSWVPNDVAASTPTFSGVTNQIFLNAAEPLDDAPPPDPLTTALSNHEKLGSAMAAVRSQVQRGWRLDSLLLGVMRTVENEATQCRAAENALRFVRLSHIGRAGIGMVGGLAIVFIILVLADLFQSLFDTATNSGAIRKRVSESRTS